MTSIIQLKATARELRKNLITMIYLAQSGHPGGSLSASDIITVLFFNEMKIDPRNPRWEDRDRFILSKGHCCPVLYSALAMLGYYNKSNLSTLRKIGSILQGHPDMNKTPGVDMTSGSLGQGLSVGVGMALALAYDGSDSRVFVMLGDGENNEGQVWEAAASAVKYKLKNLIAIVDYNGIQNDGFCRDIMPMDDLAEKWKAFGWHVIPVDGHNIQALLDVFKEVKETPADGPVCILAKTVKGRYISFMENTAVWHGKAPNDEEYRLAMKELEE